MWYVDIPYPWNSGSHGEWKMINIFNTKKEALTYIREVLGYDCDAYGNISLLSTTALKWDDE